MKKRTSVSAFLVVFYREFLPFLNIVANSLILSAVISYPSELNACRISNGTLTLLCLSPALSL